MNCFINAHFLCLGLELKILAKIYAAEAEIPRSAESRMAQTQHKFWANTNFIYI